MCDSNVSSSVGTESRGWLSVTNPALAAVGRGARDEKTLGGIARLRDQAEEVGLRIAIPALEAALATA